MSQATLDVSVVVVTHHRPELLTVLIEAELAQVVQPREIIVIDNGTDDATPQALARYAGRVVSQRVSGLPRDRSRNLGISMAAGAWISPIDDDDYHSSDFLQRVGEVIADGRATLIGGDYQAFDDRGNHRRTRFGSMPEGYWNGIKTPDDQAEWTFVGKFPIERLLVRNLLEPGQMVVSKDLFARVGAFDVDFPYPIGEMWELNARLLAQAELALIWQPILMYRRHGGNMTRGDFDARYYKLRTFEHLRDQYAGKSVSFDAAVTADIIRRRRAMFAQAFAIGDMDKVTALYGQLVPSDRNLWRGLMSKLPALPNKAARLASWFVPKVSRKLGHGQDFDFI